MKRVFTSAFLLILLCSTRASAATFAGSYLVPGIPYLTLASFINALNNPANTVVANITVNVTSDEIAPAGGFVLGSPSLNASGFSITFNGGGKILTAASGTGNHDAIFTIQGTDKVTIDNFVFQESAANTTATSMMEHGISIVKLTNNDGCKNITLQNNSFTLNKANTTAQSGCSHLGSAAIFIGNCNYLSTTALAPTVEDGTHDGLFIFRNTIQNVNEGIFVSGNQVAADGSAFNDKNATILENTVGNFTHDGIYLSYFNGDLVQKNIINNMSSGGAAPTANMLFGVRYFNNNVGLQTNTSWTCTENDIDLTITSGGAVYAATGIMTQVNGSGATSITSNTVKLTSAGASAQLNGVFSQNYLGTQNIAKNTIKDFTTLASNAQSVIGIYVGGYANYTNLGTSNLGTNGFPTNATVDENTIDNFSVTSGATAAAIPNRVAAILFDNFTTNPLTITNNKISNINITGTSVRFIGVGSIWSYGSFIATPVLHTTTFSGNTIEKITAVGSTNGTPIYAVAPLGTYPNGHTFNSSRNKVRDITGELGWAVAYLSDYCALYTMDKDTITNLVSRNWHSMGLLNGFSQPSAGNIFSSKSIIVKDCSFSGLKSNSTGGGAFAAALNIQPGTTTAVQISDITVNNNLIKDITSGDPAGYAAAVNTYTGPGTFNIHNNMISDVANAPNTGTFSSSFGLNLANSGTNNIYYNTINMSTASASGYGATGVLYNTAATNKIQNNILRVNVTAGAGNNVAAIRGSTGTASSAPTLAAFGASSNIYYTPTGPNNFLYVDGTTNASLVNGYHTDGLTPNTTKNIVNDEFFNSHCDKSLYHNFMEAGTREINTYTEDNLTGAGGVFVPAGTSFAEAAGTDVPVISDFSYASRPFGSSDIGAKEFDGSIRPKMNITITSSTGFDTACPTNLPRLTVSIPGFFTRVAYQWYHDATAIPGAKGTSITVSGVSGLYTVTVYDSVSGCEDTSLPFEMVIVPPPPAIITYYDSLVFCQTGAVVLQANRGYLYSYRWFRNSSLMVTETDDHYVAETSGDYTVEVNTPLGCPSLSTPIRVKVYPLPSPVVYYEGPRILGVTQPFYLYQWYKNNVKLPCSDPDALDFGCGPSVYIPDGGDGAYSVEVTDSNGCTAKSDVFLFSLGLTNSSLSANIKVYPNPATDVLHIESPVALRVSISDLSGRIIIPQEETNTIKLSHLADGMYLLNLIDREGNLIKVEKINKLR